MPGERFKDAFRQAWRGDRGRRLQPARAPLRPDLARGRRAARAGQVPPTGRDPFSQRYMEDTVGAHPGIVRKVVELQGALRSGARRRSCDGRWPRRAHRGGNRFRAEPRRGPHPQKLPPARPGDPPDELLPTGCRRAPEAVPLLQVRPRSRPRPPEPRPQFEIWVYSPRIEGAPARRQGRRGGICGSTGAKTSARKCSG